MVVQNAYMDGPILRKYQVKLPNVRQRVANSSEAEAYFFPDVDEITDPGFYMVTPDGILFEYSYTGDPVTASKIGSDGCSLEQILQSDAKLRFHINESALPLTGFGSARELVDYGHTLSNRIEDTLPRDADSRRFRTLDWEALSKRFDLLKNGAIIPDQSFRTMVATISQNCWGGCLFCFDGEKDKPFVPYTKTQFRSELIRKRQGLENILPSWSYGRINEGFIDSADLGALDFPKYRNREDSISSLEAVQMMQETFSRDRGWSLEKIGAFFTTKSALFNSRDDRGQHFLNGKRYSTAYFERLKAAGLNRIYIGVETGNDEGSALLGKNISKEEKILAIKLMQDAGIKVKLIIQYGTLGYGFKDSDGAFVPSTKAIEDTADLINRTLPYRVLESRFTVEYATRKYQELLDTRRIIPYSGDFDSWVEMERDLLRSKLNLLALRFKHKSFRVDAAYEEFLQMNLNSKMVIPTVNPFHILSPSYQLPILA